MDQRDRELLDKQLWGVSPSPARNGGAFGLAFVAAFLGGLLVGGTLFANKNHQTQMTAHDAPISLSQLELAANHAVIQH